MRLICDTAASCACKIGRSASPATGAGPGATTSARGDHLRERRTGPRRAWRSELPFGCLRIVPQVVRQLAGAQSHQPISQYFESRKRPVCDRALQQQSVLVVGQELQALELVSFDRALPSEEGSLRGRTRRDRRDSASTSQLRSRRALCPRVALSGAACASRRLY